MSCFGERALLGSRPAFAVWPVLESTNGFESEAWVHNVRRRSVMLGSGIVLHCGCLLHVVAAENAPGSSAP